jgi:CheY-like chemotaxis protein
MKDSPLARLRVLVLDGCPDTRQTLSLLLRLWGHEARTAADGLSALRLAVDFRPDVVLLELVLPGLGGYEVARRLRQGSAPGRPWLVAVTGQVSPRHVADALEADFDLFLAKPCEPDQLKGLLHSYALAREVQRARSTPAKVPCLPVSTLARAQATSLRGSGASLRRTTPKRIPEAS